MKVRVRVPASTSNLGPGFDTLGLALCLYDWVTVEETGDSGLAIHVTGEGADAQGISTDECNIVYQAAKRLYLEAGIPIPGLSIAVENQIPVACGLGSSAAARVGGLVAANALTGSHFSDARLVDIASELEGHPDNVAPAIFGGFTVSVTGGSYVSSLRIDPPENLQATVAVPDFHLHTSTARQLLPSEISRHDAVHNIGRSSLLVAAIACDRLDLLRTAMEDQLHQQYRQTLIPGMTAVLEAAMDAGALGAALSGAGPALLGFSRGRDAAAIGERMRASWQSFGIEARVFVLDVDRQGAEIEETIK